MKFTESQKAELQEIRDKIADLEDQIDNLRGDASCTTGEWYHTCEFVEGRLDSIEKLEALLQKIEDDKTAAICGQCGAAIPRGRTRCDACIRKAVRSLNVRDYQ